MRKLIASTLAALTVGGAVASVAAPAEAQGYYGRHGNYYYGHHGHSGDTAAAAVAAGIAGLAIGSALSSGSHSTYYRGGYYAPAGGYYAPAPGYSYYDAPPPAYGYGYRTCVARNRIWDPYIGRYVVTEQRYAC